MPEEVAFEILSERGAPQDEDTALLRKGEENGCWNTHNRSKVLVTTLAFFSGAFLLGYNYRHNLHLPGDSTPDTMGEVGSTALLNCPNMDVDLCGDDNNIAQRVCSTADYGIGTICQWTCKTPDAYGTRSLTCVNHAPSTEIPIVTWIPSSDFPGSTIPYSAHVCPPAPCDPLLFDTTGSGVATGVAGLSCDTQPDATGRYPTGSSCTFSCANNLNTVQATCSRNIWTTSQASCPPYGPNAGIQCGNNFLVLQDGILDTVPGSGANAQNRPDQKFGLYRAEWSADNINRDLENMGECARLAPATVDPVTLLPVLGPLTDIPIVISSATAYVTTPVGTITLNFPLAAINAFYADPSDPTIPQAVTSTNQNDFSTLEVIWPQYDLTHPLCLPPCAPTIAIGMFGFGTLKEPGTDKPWWPAPGTIVSFKVHLNIKYKNNPRVFTYTSSSGPITSAVFVFGGGIGKEPLTIDSNPCNTGSDPRDAIPGLACPAPMVGTTVPHVPPQAGLAYVDGTVTCDPNFVPPLDILIVG